MLLEFVEKLKTTKESGQKAEAMWADFSSRWFSLMHSTRPMRLHDFNELADHVSKTNILSLLLVLYNENFIVLDICGCRLRLLSRQ